MGKKRIEKLNDRQNYREKEIRYHTPLPNNFRSNAINARKNMTRNAADKTGLMYPHAPIDAEESDTAANASHTLK
jgi:hypothetical protein